MTTPFLADELLSLAADVLDDLERVRIANENRLRQLTGTWEGAFARSPSNEAVARFTAMVRAMKCDSSVVLELTGEKTRKAKGCCLEHEAERNLVGLLRQHPLYPWLDAQPGIGEKQAARLLGILADPYMRPEIEDEDGNILAPCRPRKVSELWALCGFHTVGGDAPRRQKGTKANWSEDARKRTWLVAVSCMKQAKGTPYRDTYDRAREKYALGLHVRPCVRCGPSGRPALPGSPLSDGHKHARALRAVAKEILKDLWREAKRLHQEAASGN